MSMFVVHGTFCEMESMVCCDMPTLRRLPTASPRASKGNGISVTKI